MFGPENGPEYKAFSDEGMGPIPSSWRGVCESGKHFNAAKSSTIAAGSFISNANYEGLGSGTVQGGAPMARLAMCKVCWSMYDGGLCAAADILKALDVAIYDGVDVLSLSIASDLPLYSDVDVRNGITLGAFHAVAHGISVICSAGNDGPNGQTVQSPAPWIITVAASSTDRSFPTPITLGNNWTKLLISSQKYGLHLPCQEQLVIMKNNLSPSITGSRHVYREGYRVRNLVYPE